MRSVGVSGTDIICHMTPAIEVKVLNRLPLFHKFVITPNSPLNLLGRDLMHKLALKLYFQTALLISLCFQMFHMHLWSNAILHEQ